jgi:hypothetical protein
MITEDVPAAHRLPARHRILYVGGDIRLPGLLEDALDCHVVRCPDGSTARLFIEGDTKYSLFLFDEGRAKELERLAWSLKHRERTPTLRTSGDFRQLVYTIWGLLRD